MMPRHPSANALAIAAPIPRVPPVTSATRGMTSLPELFFIIKHGRIEPAMM
jgi:hypothetical protein